MTTERGIIMSAPMVRAILAGTKTVTRRVVKPQPAGEWAAPGRSACPYGVAGDRLWVRETWAELYKGTKAHDVEYRAACGSGLLGDLEDAGVKWRPSIFMPRWASRIDMEIESIRVERLQEITEEDARAEGVTLTPCGHPDCGPDDSHGPSPHRGAFCLLWNSINGKRAGCSWADSPWVWRIAFRRIRP